MDLTPGEVNKLREGLDGAVTTFHRTSQVHKRTSEAVPAPSDQHASAIVKLSKAQVGIERGAHPRGISAGLRRGALTMQRAIQRPGRKK
jgi:hypothetical protein